VKKAKRERKEGREGEEKRTSGASATPATEATGGETTSQRVGATFVHHKFVFQHRLYKKERMVNQTRQREEQRNKQAENTNWAVRSVGWCLQKKEKNGKRRRPIVVSLQT
jgi:hypothetical protein